ncbi:proprotein convertase P-domain-containing protein [Stackebrandtia endophytica]|uniref:proprotein convertase P-domain-containing protein n=1 Tax=Stackebrandtia endophytica TaxID=1496996 RepID=UPI00114D6171
MKDNGITTTDIAISGCDTDSLANSSIAVDITHPDQGELSIYLYAPDGSYYVLKRNGGSGADLTETYSVDLSGETANGTWTLSVKDYASGNTGTINEWAVSLS